MSNQNAGSNILTARLVRWCVIHAACLFSLTLVAWFIDSLWVVSLAGAISFLGLILIMAPYWTPQKVFGWANSITTIRLGGILIVGLISIRITGLWIIIISLVLLTLDGVDGWLARRFNQASEFGEYFDKETDAFFVLVLSLSIVANQRLGLWIVIMGLLRYAFVLILHFYQPKVYKERRSIRGRLIYLLVMIALMACFLPFPAIYKPFALIATLFLIYSFAEDLRWLYIK